MDARLQEMLDHYEITKTLNEYCHGCDRADEKKMAAVYLEDSWDDHGDVKATGPEFARIMMAQILSHTSSLYHSLGQSLIKVDGDKAGAETYFLAVAHSSNDAGQKLCNQLGGRFVDKLERDNGRWLIKHRIVVKDWAISLVVEKDWTANRELTDGQRSSADPGFGVLGQVHSGFRAAQR